MTGKPDFERREPHLLLDESLVPAVAEALSLVGYTISSTLTTFERQGVGDPEIIEWCRSNEAVWIHADDRARRQHGKLIQTAGIRTIWVYRTRGAMSAREQLRVLSFALPKLMESWRERPRDRHYRVSAANPTSTPSVRPVHV